jgi:hypothetical protein
VTYFGGDSDRHFDILINDQKIAEVNLDGFQGDGFVDVDYQIPESVVKEAPNGVITVKFSAHDGSLTGGIYHVRLMRK